MTRSLMIKILLLRRYYTEAQVCSDHGPHYNASKLETFLWRCLHDWSTRRGIFLSDMDGIGIFGLALLLLHRCFKVMLVFSLWSFSFLYFFCAGAVCIMLCRGRVWCTLYRWYIEMKIVLSKKMKYVFNELEIVSKNMTSFITSHRERPNKNQEI